MSEFSAILCSASDKHCGARSTSLKVNPSSSYNGIIDKSGPLEVLSRKQIPLKTKYQTFRVVCVEGEGEGS